MALATVAQLQFSKPRALLAAIAGAFMVLGCAYMAIDSFVWFTARYEAGYGGRKWFAALNYETNGWAGAIFFGLCGGFFVRPWMAAVRRLGSDSFALAITESTLRVHSSFGLGQTELPLNHISGFELTTEGKALSSGERTVSGLAPLGSQWLVNRSMKKVCLLLFLDNVATKPKKIHVSAQFVLGGAEALQEFYAAISASLAKKPSPELR
jgi:hypothetical protein